MSKPWGQILILDLHGCEKQRLQDPKLIRTFIKEIVEEIGMVRYGKPMLKRFGTGRLEGYSALQFIETSSITIHLDEFANRAFIDIFSCKPFDSKKAKQFATDFFRAKKAVGKTMLRG